MIGETFSHYRITGKLGSGGMGDVYCAEDMKLKREVAIKVLPEAFARDEERMKRFEREGQVLASLNHPNVAAIYGIEEVDGVRGIVLELVEGPTLADRIATGPLPLEEAQRIARQIALGLEAAHEKSIVHRDLKPANVKLTRDGDVKILDFGLAKALEGETAEVESSQSPTMTRAATQVGVLLGTAGYMSPEQAKGKRVDRRADIWAFGVVFFEMLTGKKLFSGETVSETLASVIKDEATLERLPAATPLHLRHLLRRCLTKDPMERLQAIGEARIAIDHPVEETAPVSVQRSRVAPWVAAVLLALAAAVLGWRLKPEASRPVARFVATPPSSAPMASTPGLDVAITPDDTHLIYVVREPRGHRLVVRALDRLETTVLAGPDENPQNLAVSPDGNWIAYIDRDHQALRKVSIQGGPPMTLVPRGGVFRGASFGDDGSLVFSSGGQLWRIGAPGGKPEALTPSDSDHRWPEVLPGAKAVLFTVVTGAIDSAQIAVLSLATGDVKTLLEGGSNPRYLSTGHIVYGVDGTLRAVGFDLDPLEVTSEPVPVLEGIVTKETGAADFAVARDGSLVYVKGDRLPGFQRALVWVDRQGHEEALTAPLRAYFYPRLSPDGSQLALDVRDGEGDIWIWDFARETLTRLTFDPSPDLYPSWEPDGLRIAFGSGNPTNLYWKAADGTGDAKRLTESPLTQDPHVFSPDGRLLIYRVEDPENKVDLGIFSLKDGKVSTLLSTPFNERNAELSPDGRFLAYDSDESGRYEVFVRPFPNVGEGRWQVSTSGGGRPLWARSGRELFYMTPGGQVMAVPVQTEPGFSGGKPELVVDGVYFAGPPYGRPYDVSPDGKRFLMIKEVDSSPGGALIYVQNWAEELRRH